MLIAVTRAPFGGILRRVFSILPFLVGLRLSGAVILPEKVLLSFQNLHFLGSFYSVLTHLF